jgi:serine phosphatase RsbU (regulator of sigma subunit)
VKTILLYFIVFFSLMFQGLAQKSSPDLNGTFLLQNYGPKDYSGNPQVFDIVQDSRGVMYFSNQKGIIEYDGTKWSTIQIGVEDLKCLSLAVGQEGLVYAGAEGDFGVLRPDASGSLQFVSELERLGFDSIGRVKQIIINDNKKYLKTEKQLIVITGDSLEKITPETEMTKIFFLNNKLYVLQKGLGLFLLTGKELKPVEEGYQFSNKEVIELLTFGNRKLFFTGQDGLYEMSNTGRLVKRNIFNGISLWSATKINDNLLSLGTNSNGIIVVDQKFNIVYSIGLEKGIIDAGIKTQFIDNEKNLWLGTNNGISKIEISSPLLKYDKNIGIRTTVQSIVRHNNKIHVAALDGVYCMTDDGFFESIRGIEADCYGLQRFPIDNDTLLIVSELNTVIGVDKKNEKIQLQPGGPYEIQISPLNPNEAIIVHYNGLANLVYENGEFITENYLRNFTGAEPFNFVVQEDGTIWIGTIKSMDGGVYKTHVNIFRDSTIGFERFYTEEGLPSAGSSYMFQKDNDIFVGTDKGLFKYEKGRFILYNDFGVDFSEGRGLHRISQDQEGNIWMVLFDKENNYEIGYSSKVEGKYVWNSSIFSRYSDDIVHALFHEENGITWLGGTHGLIRFDSKVINDYKTPFNALIRSVVFGDSLLFGGSYQKDNKNILEQPEELKFDLRYSSNKPIIFSFASTSFIDEKKTEYSFLLEGHDDDWHKWSPRIMKEYYLSEGSYSFKVKARNINGVVSSEAVFSFTVLPPWYRTSWAYVLYVVGFVIVVYTIIRLSIRRVRQKNIQLEGLVEERTKEVVIQKQDAEKQRDIAERQKELVEQAHREITDSINYAERIQRSFLATNDILDKNLEEYFVFFQPKDVVSGDFYWADKLSNGNFAMVNADSTGHGVPGAIMSILNISSIEKAIEQKLLEPASIFNSTRKTIIERLKKDGSPDGGKDGMDASIICFDFPSNKFTYTAAQNPIWIVRDGALTEIKPEKMPVGKHDKDKVPFVGGVFEMKKGDVIYTLTDGFQDQFGGLKGKKFMVKKMREYILSISHLPMKEQYTRISEVFSNWKGDTEQVDDVCVIGVRI